MMRNASLIVVSGPSGVGKQTVIDSLLTIQPDKFLISLSATTRKPRKNERNGVDYWFLTVSEFQERIQRKMFIEWARVAGQFYGTPVENMEQAKKMGRILILEIDVQGGIAIINRFKEQVLSFFLVPPSFEDLKKRLKARGTETNEQIDIRLKLASIELSQKSQYDFVVVNDIPAHAAKRIYEVLTKEIL